jgi:hypothetical protein
VVTSPIQTATIILWENKMDKAFAWAVVKRFVRAFITGGVAQAVIICSTSAPGTWEDFGRWLLVLLVAFLTGGIMALDKLLRFKKA